MEQEQDQGAPQPRTTRPGRVTTPAYRATPLPAGSGGPLLPAGSGGPQLDIVDTLISAGIAPNRAEAIRWALGHISERLAYAQLRERTREIERLKSEF